MTIELLRNECFKKNSSYFNFIKSISLIFSTKIRNIKLIYKKYLNY